MFRLGLKNSLKNNIELPVCTLYHNTQYIRETDCTFNEEKKKLNKRRRNEDRNVEFNYPQLNVLYRGLSIWIEYRFITWGSMKHEHEIHIEIYNECSFTTLWNDCSNEKHCVTIRLVRFQLKWFSFRNGNMFRRLHYAYTDMGAILNWVHPPIFHAMNVPKWWLHHNQRDCKFFKRFCTASKCWEYLLIWHWTKKKFFFSSTNITSIIYYLSGIPGT